MKIYIVSELENMQIVFKRQVFTCRYTPLACALAMQSTEGRHPAASFAALLRMLQKLLFLNFGDYNVKMGIGNFAVSAKGKKFPEPPMKR